MVVELVEKVSGSGRLKFVRFESRRVTKQWEWIDARWQ